MSDPICLQIGEGLSRVTQYAVPWFYGEDLFTLLSTYDTFKDINNKFLLKKKPIEFNLGNELMNFLVHS